MTPSLMAEMDPPSLSKPGSRWCLLTVALATLAVWAQMISKLVTDWSANQQYEFGIFVPFFVAVLIHRRWSERPPAVSDVSPVILGAAAAILLGLLLPIRVIQEANPDWRPLNWVDALVVCSLTLLVFAALGGTRWMRYFGVPLLLIFFAIPWPLAAEQGIIQFLSRLVTSGTTELLNWCNISAIQRGNVIEVANGLVGVNEACSGIRSFAATLMAAAFFGEFYLLSWWRRGALIVFGVVVAFALNLVRAFVLGLLQANFGGEGLEHWHDTVGLSIFVLSFAVLWWAASFFSTPSETNAVAERESLASLASVKVSLWIPLAVVCWIGAVEVLREVWYQTRERDLPEAKLWSMAWPESNPRFRFGPVSDEVKSILRFSEAANGTFAPPGEAPWSVYFLRWRPGRTSAQLAVMHRPEICLPASGARYLHAVDPLTVHAQGLAMPFTGSLFDVQEGGRLYVYRCLWEDKMLTGAMRDRNFDMSVRGRLLSAWYGRRNTGQRLLQIGIMGVNSENAAREDLQRRLPALIKAGA